MMQVNADDNILSRAWRFYVVISRVTVIPGDGQQLEQLLFASDRSYFIVFIVREKLFTIINRTDLQPVVRRCALHSCACIICVNLANNTELSPRDRLSSGKRTAVIL